MDAEGLQIIELHMMDKYKYYPLAAISGISIRFATYPLVLVRTRLQVQRQKALYTGTIDALRKIFKSEGPKGFYKGFGTYTLTMVSSMVYIYTYEGSRQFLSDNLDIQNKYTRGFLAGGLASLAGQPIQIPIDIVAQHQQMYSGLYQKDDTIAKGRSRIRTREVIKQIYCENGIRGFYRGFGPSVMSYALSSACFWTAYTCFGELWSYILPAWFPHLLAMSFAGGCASVAVNIITNPVDLVRTRMQVHKSRLQPALRMLLKEEGVQGLFLKGASVRIAHSFCFAALVLMPYEGIKKLSLLPEYKKGVRW